MARQLLTPWWQVSPVPARQRRRVPRTPTPWYRFFRPVVELLEARIPPGDLFGGPLLSALGSDSGLSAPTAQDVLDTSAPQTGGPSDSSGSLSPIPGTSGPGPATNPGSGGGTSGGTSTPGPGDGSGPTAPQGGGGASNPGTAPGVATLFGGNGTFDPAAPGAGLFGLPVFPGLSAGAHKPHGHPQAHHAHAKPHGPHPGHHRVRAGTHGHHHHAHAGAVLPGAVPPPTGGPGAALLGAPGRPTPQNKVWPLAPHRTPPSGGSKLAAGGSVAPPTTANGISPLEATVGPVVDASAEPGNQAEEAIATNPLNPNQVFIEANEADILGAGNPGVSVSYSTDGGQTFHTRTTGDGSDNLPLSAGDPSVTWDQFGNLFMSYIDFNLADVDIMMSTDGGVSFTQIASISGTGSSPRIDQPTIVTGPGSGGQGQSIWVSFNDFGGTGDLVATGAPILGPGQVGSFLPLFFVPNSQAGNFGDIAIGPKGQVMVAFQHDDSGVGPDTISVSVKPDGLGSGDFTTPVIATSTNIGGFTPILAQPDRSIDAEAGLAWDRSGGPRNGRVYLVYTDAPSLGANMTSTDIFVRTSDDNGATWSSPIRVNDETGNLHFLPKMALDQTTGDVGVSWYDTRNDNGLGGFNDLDGVPNDEPEFYASISTDGDCFQKNIQLTTRPSSAIVNNDMGFDFGDYTGAWFDHNVFRPAWADNSAAVGGNPDVPNFDIATAAIQVPIVLGRGVDFEPNDTSDRAHSFGIINPGTAESLQTVPLLPHPNELPDYDWYRWRPQTAGIFTAGLNVEQSNGSLELHVFTVDASGTLIELGSASTGPSEDCTFNTTVSIPARRNESILVEVKGANTSLGVHAQGIYDLTVALS